MVRHQEHRPQFHLQHRYNGQGLDSPTKNVLDFDDSPCEDFPSEKRMDNVIDKKVKGVEEGEEEGIEIDM